VGDYRSYVVLLSSQFASLLEALASHGVRTDQTPKRLNYWLIGRK